MQSRTGSVRVFPLTLLLAGLVVAAGCGGSKVVPVSGKVLKADGSPLPTGTVTFHPDTSKGNTAKLPFPPVGDIKDGQYTVAGGKKEGVPPGAYKVTITSSAPLDPKNPYSEVKSLISEVYSKPETTPLSIEVKPEGGTIDLKLPQ